MVWCIAKGPSGTVHCQGGPVVRCIARVAQWCGALLVSGPVVWCIARVVQWCGALPRWSSGAVHCQGGPVVWCIARVDQWCGALLGWPSGAVHC